LAKSLALSHLERAIRHFSKSSSSNFAGWRRWRNPNASSTLSSTESRIPPYAVGAETVPALDALLKWARLRAKMLDDGAPVSLQEYAFSASRLLSVGVGDLAAKLANHVHARTPRRPLVAHYP